MKMKLFYASETIRIIELETEVNAFLGALPATAKIFAVNTASTAHDTGNVPTVTITVWYDELGFPN
ncbi:MAG: hypothetical protein WA459_10885 [Stellaceae bacterium]